MNADGYRRALSCLRKVNRSEHAQRLCSSENGNLSEAPRQLKL